MADPIRIPHSDPEHPLREVSAHLHGELTPEEEAAFQAHLPTCPECQQALRVGETLLPLASKLLAEEPPLKTGAEYLKLLAEARAKNAAEDEAKAAKLRSFPARRGWRPYLPWLVGGAAIAAAVATVMVLDPFTAGLEPELLHAGSVEFAPWADAGLQPPRPVPPLPAKLALSAAVRFGRLELGAPREPTDIYTAVVLIDSSHHLWVVQPADKRDPACTPACGPLTLRVELDRLPPGAFQVAVLASTFPLFKGDLEGFLQDPTEVEAGRMKVQGAAITTLER